mmetsp:Transcript_24084/g.26859  ORF Transcript_24084/g.26859 Transcript_24084/m.26859 type:complete len:348 (-) Transcript_24084:249-1292(-)
MNEATPLSNSVEGMVGKGTYISTATGDNNNNNNNSRFRTTVVTFVSGMVVTMMMMLAVSNTNTHNNFNGINNNNNVNYLEDSEGEVIRGRSKGFKYGAYGATRDKSSKSSKSWKSSKKSTSPPGPTPSPRTASIRIVENIDPTDPNGSGDIILSLGFNPLTQALSLVGSNFVTNGSVFRSQDIQVVEGELVAPIPFEQQLGDSSSTCTITKGTFQPDQGVVFIKSATCHYATCFPTARTVVVEDEEEDEEEEFCFFGMSGGTLDIDAATLIFGKTIKGVLQGGTGPFGGFAGSFTVNKIVQGVFPPPSPTDIQYNIFQVDFLFAETMDMDGCPMEICEQQEPRYQTQ